MCNATAANMDPGEHSRCTGRGIKRLSDSHSSEDAGSGAIYTDFSRWDATRKCLFAEVRGDGIRRAVAM